MDNRFVKAEGIEAFTGNELIVKGALEASVALVTGYPGSPVSEVFDVLGSIRELLKEHGILAQIANNEALSAARLNGARMGNVRAMAVMKSLGMHVASDGLALDNLIEPNNEGGGIVVVGDDPWIESTQINNDSRFIAQHLHMPVMEPATFQELKDWVDIAFRISSKANLCVAYLITTNQADGGGTIHVGSNRYPTVNTKARITLDTQRIPLDDLVLLPPRTWWKEAKLPERFAIAQEIARQTQISRILYANGRRPLGFVAGGLSYAYLEHALDELGMSQQFPILKLGLTYPVDPALIQAFLPHVETIVVVEEKRDFVEGQVVKCLRDFRQQGALTGEIPVWGKRFPRGLPGFPEVRGLNASVVIERLVPLFEQFLDGELKKPAVPIDRQRLAVERRCLQETANFQVRIPARTPTFCPGCPHRDSSSVFLEVKRDFRDPVYMQKQHRRGPVDLLFHGETGCFTMLMFPPNQDLMHNYAGMGLGGGTGAGIDPFITNKQVVFLGDSTFFHSGMLAISDSLKHGQDIAYVILDNKTTAMTGHQPTPGNDYDVMGRPTFAQSIERIVEGMTHGTGIAVTRVNPAYRASYRQLIEETILQDGVKVIIADKECGITYHRRVKREKKQILKERGFLPQEQHMNITPEVCEFCLECTRVTGCPGLTIEDTWYGPKIVTDRSTCVDDGACAKVKACPSFEEVVVTRRQAPVDPWIEQRLSEVTVPEVPFRRVEKVWCAYTAAVGGMGAGVVTSILVRAGVSQGYQVLFADKKGLAIRNGGVYAHVLYSVDGVVRSPIIPYGKADLLLGIDLLEAVRGLDPHATMRVASPQRTVAVVNTAKTPTILTLMGEDDFSPQELEATLKRYTRSEAYFGADASAFSERLFGSKLYTNIMLLGMAYQHGALPVALENLRQAIRESVRPEELEQNLRAFQAGRILVHTPARVLSPSVPLTYREMLEAKASLLRKRFWNGRSLAQAYQHLVGQAVARLGLDEVTHRQFALRVYDLIHYENLKYAATYVARVLAIRARDTARHGWEATKAVIQNLHKVLLIKDEVYVAHLLTSPEKRQRDRERYGVEPNRGDRIRYFHLNRPQFTVFGRDFEWDMRTRDWQLAVMKRLKVLRRWLPGWHAREKAFRDWYVSLVDRFTYQDETTYTLYLQALRVPETVKGYRAIRYPKMEEAQRFAEQLIRQASEPVRTPALVYENP
ncbi:MAG: 2-oxoacid:acceptor oxidoreductase family protein [Elusimicrobia bacterium]|nr:2-oxoacid:acceptor oxidoreductase family protein [Elusimicrobiota bacterium]